MHSNFIQAVFDKLFLADGKRFVVVYNHDGFLLSEDVKNALYEAFGVKTYSGTSLDLRLVRETIVAEDKTSYVLFVSTERFEILEDVASEVSCISFQLRSMFSSYLPADMLQVAPLSELERQYDSPDIESLVRYKSPTILKERFGDEATVEMARWRWENNLKRLDFNKPSEWMNKAAEILLQVIENGWWNDFHDEIKSVNEEFLAYLKENYVNIVSSTCGALRPRIVTHVMPFLKKRADERSALVVVDGMNFWQAMMLLRSLKAGLGVAAKVDCIYSWLPSVTELSRQAIFMGDIPDTSYVQSPANEGKLWKEFWVKNGLAAFEQYYQHSGELTLESSVKKVGYVVADLDDMMHGSLDYKYLYANTKVWVNEPVFINNIKRLLDSGYKVYITTDHGNVETTSYRRLDGRDKLGADLSLRHITINESLDKDIFESSYEGHIEQLNSCDRTYYAVGNEAFMNGGKCVTHGGLHFLEVLIPFITID